MMGVAKKKPDLMIKKPEVILLVKSVLGSYQRLIKLLFFSPVVAHWLESKWQADVTHANMDHKYEVFWI